MAEWLKNRGHDVRVLAGSLEHGISDESVLRLALQEKRIVITNDKDFGDLIYGKQHPHAGVILFRLHHESKDMMIQKLSYLLEHYGNKIQDHFIVVTDTRIRVRESAL